MAEPAPVTGSDPLPAPPVHPQRLVFLGTPSMSVPPLQALHAAGHDIALVVTGADKRRGRRGEASPTPVKLAALALGLEVSHDITDAVDVGADLGVVVAFGQLIRRPILERLPMINIHFSLLPRWRGAAPVERAILAGDDRTGVCIMGVAEGLDTGDVYACREVAIRRSSTTASLGAQLTALGSDLLVDTLARGLDQPVPQAGEETYAHKLTTANRELHWDRPAAELDRVIRVGSAWTTFRGRRLKVLRADLEGTSSGPPATDAAVASPIHAGELIGTRVATGDGMLRLVEVQPEGKGPVAADDWLRGSRIEPGERLGHQADQPGRPS